MPDASFNKSWPLVAGALVLAAGMVACTPGSRPVEPKVLTFNYMLQAYADPAALIADLNSGQTTVASELPANPCNFTADAALSTPLSIDLLGTPGNAGFNVTITSSTLINITTSNAPNCRNATEINMTIGDINESLGVGGTTNKTGATLILGGDSYSSSGNFFEGSLTAYNSSSGYGSGDFHFVATSSASAPGVLLLVSGAWADD